MRTAFIFSYSWTPGLHIGAARIALMNYLLAKKHKGQMYAFCNTYEKPYPVKSTSVSFLLHWLGVPFECGPYYMIHFDGIYERAVAKLLDHRFAYYDYATAEEMNEERRTWQRANRSQPFSYSRKYAAFTESERTTFEKEGRRSVIRLRMPRSTEDHFQQESIVIDDKVFGRHKFDLAFENDHIIKRSDGTYTPCLTTPVTYDHWDIDVVVSDSWHWRIMPAQRFIASRLGLTLPTFAHVPYLLEPETNRRFSAKRLKQHMDNEIFADLYNRAITLKEEIEFIGSNGPFHPSYLEFYKNVGFLPGAMRHYLLASACVPHSSLRSKQVMSLNGLIEYFDLDQISKEPDHFNTSHLMAVQKSYMDSHNLNEKAWLVNDFLRRVGMSELWSTKCGNQQAPEPLRSMVRHLSDRIVIGGDILSLTAYFDDTLRYRQLDTSGSETSDYISEGCPNF